MLKIASIALLAAVACGGEETTEAMVAGEAACDYCPGATKTQKDATQGGGFNFWCSCPDPAQPNAAIAMNFYPSQPVQLTCGQTQCIWREYTRIVGSTPACDLPKANYEKCVP
jgi:hypothetical protein